MRASVTRAGQAMSGLLLLGALLPGCPSGDKGLCGGEVTYGVTLVAGDDYTESVKDDLGDQLTLVIEQTDEAPDEPFNCMANRGDWDENVTADLVATSWAGFDREQEFELVVTCWARTASTDDDDDDDDGGADLSLESGGAP